MTSISPGWYKDPADPTTQRYWDGGGWIGAPLPADVTPPDGPPPAEEPPASAGPPSPDEPEAQPPSYPAQSYPPPPPDYPAAPPPGWAGYQLPPPEPRPQGMALAPLGARLAARLIDIGAVLLLNIFINGWFVWQYVVETWPTFSEIWRRSLANDRSTEGLPQVTERASGLQMVIILLAAAIWWAYEVPAVANTGQTLGKRLAGIKVVPVEPGGQLGFARSFRRWNTLGLPTLLWICCVGFILQLIDCVYLLFDRPLRQALHDKSAQTVVVQLPPGVPAAAAGPGGGRTGGPGTDRDTPGSSA
ncbi:RDD family protein [Micromonospora sp. LOL_015]|uniref:RDD family protein n=1 Tax=Micromonospora sp. LOL_015 TaxID=3345416 RepID=UPI003A88E716